MILLNKIKKNYFLLLSTLLFFYIFFNLLDGERGLISFFEKKEKHKIISEEKKNLIVLLNDIENKNSLLSDQIDLDYLETLIRDKFFYGQKGEKVYLIKKNEN